MTEIAQFFGHSDSRITERVYARYSPTISGKQRRPSTYEIVSGALFGYAEPTDRTEMEQDRPKCRMKFAR